MHRKRRILIVSDSLGASIHARGIFNYTCGLVEILNQLDLDTHLVVETPHAGILAQTGAPDGSLASSATSRAIFSDLIKHFEDDRFGFDWQYPAAALQCLSIAERNIAHFRLSVEDTLNARKQVSLGWHKDELSEYQFGPHSDHLNLFSGLIFIPGIYAESFRRGFHGLRPASINASGFDYVIIDTPHYVRIGGVPASRIAYVIHDFIPLFDVHMGFDWRQLFTRKLECTVSTGRKAIFNSETTGKYFKKFFATGLTDRDIVIYPPIGANVEKAALNADRKAPSNYVRDIAANKKAERLEWIERIKERFPGNPSLKGISVPEWKPDLPYFFSLLSDEPRKKIDALVAASRHFVGRVNVIIGGQINGNRHMEERPEDFPNLHFAGYISDVQKFDLLRACTGFVFPSVQEGFGIPIIEAAMFGAPVICSDIEVFREVTFGNAYYFDPDNPATLVQTMEGLLKDRGFDTRALELGRRARAAYSQEEMSRRVGTLLQWLDEA